MSPAKPEPLTELEGAILMEVAFRGDQTAFQVRRSFAASPSLEWRGSAGAVYSAVKRLTERRLLVARATGDRRATRLLSVSTTGREAMVAWASDPERAASPGLDPFRIRAGVWLSLGPRERKSAVAAVRRQLRADVAYLETFHRHGDVIERASVDLTLRLHKARLEWLRTL